VPRACRFVRAPLRRGWAPGLVGEPLLARLPAESFAAGWAEQLARAARGPEPAFAGKESA
jgi:hypothetical protein